MVDTYYSIAPLLPALNRKQLILTANNRLRNHLLRAYIQECGSAETNGMISPRVFTLQQWIDHQWQTLQGKGWAPSYAPIATSFQRQWLWQNIIQESSLASGLLQPAPLAQAADSALHNLELWQLNEEDIKKADPLMGSQSNSHSFLVWLGEFRNRLLQLGLITQEEALKRLIDAHQQDQLGKEPEVILLGFDDIPPLHKQFLETACETLVPAPSHSRETRLHRTECLQIDDEFLAAALWSKEQLQADPTAMIGIIVPNLGQCRAAVEQAFTQVFEPTAAAPDQPRFTLPFNFSAGTPLATCPLIAATLELLSLHNKQWSLEEICHLLYSPFWGDFENEQVFRTFLVNSLKQQARFFVSAGDLRYHAQFLSTQLPSPFNEKITHRLLQLEAHRHSTFGKHRASYWTDLFSDLLQSIGWPGQRRLDSQEHQQLSLWNQILDVFNQLDSCDIQLTYAQAQQELRKIAGKTPFQAQTPLSPIQILGALESAGLEFSHCWVMGLHHRQWPPAPSPNPLLPILLQRKYKMPHANAERELLFARSLTQHYRQCAPLVIFSSATHADGQQLSPSALIRDIPLTPLESLINCTISDAAYYEQQLAASKQLEFVIDDRGPAVDKNREKIRGGTGILKEQASCPFNAFAKVRLGAKNPDAPVAGFSPIERGNMLHDALATIWRILKDQQTLLALPPQELTPLISDAVDAAVTRVQNRRGNSVGTFYANLEKERLLRLLSNWFDMEKQRPAFRVIAIEEPLEIEFAGLSLSLRIDRVDQLHTGDLLLIDYKTGNSHPKQWQGERPEEPQLPLYALVTPDTPAAIAFAQINAKNMQWQGIGSLQITHSGIETHPQWQQQLTDWQQTLSQLAMDFMAGHAEVDFSNNKAQAYAEDLLPLNRLPEQELIHKYQNSTH